MKAEYLKCPVKKMASFKEIWQDLRIIFKGISMLLQGNYNLLKKSFLIWQQKTTLPKSTKLSNTNLKIDTHAR